MIGSSSEPSAPKFIPQCPRCGRADRKVLTCADAQCPMQGLRALASCAGAALVVVIAMLVLLGVVLYVRAVLL